MDPQKARPSDFAKQLYEQSVKVTAGLKKIYERQLRDEEAANPKIIPFQPRQPR
jgi:hypothetical protein